MHTQYNNTHNNTYIYVRIVLYKYIFFLQNESQSIEHVTWDRLLVSWLSYKRLPFTFFNDELTQKLFQRINTNINMPKRNAMKEKVMNEYYKMKDNLKKILNENESKFSFAIDGWTAPNFESYYGITIHFIDNNWKFQSLALDFVPSNGKHTGKDIANIFFNSIKDYDIQKKVQGITLDNAAANTTFIQEFSELMDNEGIVFDTEDQHFRCFAHIINLAVQEVLKLINVNIKQRYNNLYLDTNEYNDSEDEHENELNDDEMNENENKFFSHIINNIRNTCKKIRQSEQLTIRLKLFCEAANIKFVKPVRCKNLLG